MKLRFAKSALFGSMLLALLVSGFSIGVAGADPPEEPMVYDADLDETVPAELQQALRDSQSFVTAPDEDSSEVNAEPSDDPAPDPYAASTAPVDLEGDTPPPFSASVLRPTNAWSTGTTSSARIVYAGADGSDPSQGRLIDVLLDYNGESEEEIVTPNRPTGALTIDDWEGEYLFLSGNHQIRGKYHLPTKTLTICSLFDLCGADQ
jgi:hypothetical protein